MRRKQLHALQQNRLDKKQNRRGQKRIAIAAIEVRTTRVELIQILSVPDSNNIRRNPEMYQVIHESYRRRDCGILA